MKFEVTIAKNEEYSLVINNINIYSKYNPRADAIKFILKEYDENAKGYLLLGLGLGYHLEQLIKLDPDKKIKVLIIDQKEVEIYNNFSSDSSLILNENVELIVYGKIKLNSIDIQPIIPIPFMKAIGYEHFLYPFLEDIKIKQMSIETFEVKLEKNFRNNILNNDPSINNFCKISNGKTGILISAGPSLDKSISVLERIQSKAFVLCVGSALNILLEKNIIPDAVIITDPSPLVVEQILDTNYKGLLFYLATANHEMTRTHLGKKVILFQKGYLLSEEYAKNHKLGLIDTGGSVATTAVSLMEYMGFEKLCLFGQDFGYQGKFTHSKSSTSNVVLEDPNNLRKVIANSGEYINTRADLNIFRRWFEKKAIKTKMKIFNSAWSGAKVEGMPFISENKIIELFLNLPRNNKAFLVENIDD